MIYLLLHSKAIDNQGDIMEKIKIIANLEHLLKEKEIVMDELIQANTQTSHNIMVFLIKLSQIICCSHSFIL